MSKLLKLKQWLTVNETAKYLSGALSEPVTEADIFRLALDGALTLSAYFVSSIYGKFGQSVPIANAKKIPGIPVAGMEPYEVTIGVRINNNSEVLEFDEQIRSVEDIVFDLPLIGGERINCEQEYQQLTNGPYVEMTNIEGTFLRVPNSGKYIQVYESYQPKPKEGDTRSSWERHKDLVWFPVGTLSRDAVFVVRIDSLTKILTGLSADDVHEKPLLTKERNVLLTIIAVLCKEYKIDYTKAAKTATLIQGMADFMKVNIGESTIEGHLKRIPEALGTRTR